MKKILLLFIVCGFLYSTAMCQDKGFYGIVEWEGVSSLDKDCGLTGPKLALGQQINQYISAGFFGGYLFSYKDPDNLANCIFGLDLRSHFFKGQVKPFVNLQVGASWARYQVKYNMAYIDNSLSLYVSPKIGCKLRLSKIFGMSIYAGYEYSVNFNDSFSFGNGINFGLGFNFGK